MYYARLYYCNVCVYVLVLIIDQIHERLYGKRMYYKCHISLELHMLFCTIILELENCKAITNFTIKKSLQIHVTMKIFSVISTT
jgi:hypothetical protein